MKIYIAGKISGLAPAGVQRKFEAAAAELRDKGYVPEATTANPMELGDDLPF